MISYTNGNYIYNTKIMCYKHVRCPFLFCVYIVITKQKLHKNNLYCLMSKVYFFYEK